MNIVLTALINRINNSRFNNNINRKSSVVQMSELELPNIEWGNHIPRVIYQTWESKDLPEVMQRVQKIVRDANPTFEIKLFDTNERREFIKNNFPAEIVYAYDTLIPGAFQADLWRYCILYMYGGVYLDISWYPDPGCSFETFINKERYCKDWPSNFSNGRGVINGFMMVYAGNPYLKEAIRCIYKNCVSKSYDVRNQLYVTGPGVLSEIVPPNLEFTWYYSPDSIIRSIEDNRTIISSSPECRAWMTEYYKNNSKEHYHYAFLNRRVYRDL